MTQLDYFCSFSIPIHDTYNVFIRRELNELSQILEFFCTLQITRYLFRNGKPLGSDLRATDIQRDRDHGLASYNDVREYCGLPRATDFDDFTDYISFEVSTVAQNIGTVKYLNCYNTI